MWLSLLIIVNYNIRDCVDTINELVDRFVYAHCSLQDPFRKKQIG